MARRLIATLVAVLLVAGGLAAAAPATADDPPTDTTAPAPVFLTPDPILLTYFGPPPHGCPGTPPLLCYFPTPLPTLHVLAQLRQQGVIFGAGPAVPGENVVFSVGAKPTEANPDGTLVICKGTTNSAGIVSCDNGKPGPALVLSLLGLGGWVSHPATADYGFAVAKVPLIAQACDNPFC
jgi:hypothetical protein